MLKKHAQLFESLFIASDLLVVSIAWTFSYWLRFTSDLFPIDKGIPDFIDYLRMILFVWIIWGFVFSRFGLYRPMRGMAPFREVWLVVKANSLSVILMLAATYLFREKSIPFSRLVFVIFFIFSSILTISSRSLIRFFLRQMRLKGYNLRHVLIVGSGELASNVANRILVHPESGYEIVGCLTADRSEEGFYNNGNGNSFYSVSGSALRRVRNNELNETRLCVVGTYQDLPRLLAKGGIDQVIVALPLHDHDKLPSVINSIGDSIVDVKIVPDFHQFIQLGSLVEEFDGLPVVSIASTPLSGINRITKRIVDIVFGTIFLIIALPIMLITALIVRVTSPGPIFFSQERVGLDGKLFRIYKFRTMSTDAEKSGARFAIPGDPRVTKVGKVLRKLSIDELPQLINVIRGHMSLVGPRPERPVFIEDFRKKFPGYMLRHKVQAGMTGWAQINGWRGDTSIEKRIEHDLYYIEHWSLTLDIKIISLTIVNCFRSQNAY